jgi:hypothetical protein
VAVPAAAVVPTVAVPAATGVPAVAVPTVAVPTVAVPTVAVPTVAAPAVAVPTVAGRRPVRDPVHATWSDLDRDLRIRHLRWVFRAAVRRS